MKKLIILFVVALMSVSAQAQSVSNPGEKYPVYCAVKGYNFWGVGKVKVMLDFGAKTKSFETLIGEDGKQIKFNTMMEVINYMAKRGWELDRTYVVSEGMSKQNVINYVLKKYVVSDDEIRKDLVTEPEKD